MPHPVKCRYLGHGNHLISDSSLSIHFFFFKYIMQAFQYYLFYLLKFWRSAIWVTLFFVFFSPNSLPSCFLPIRQFIVCRKCLHLKPRSLYGTLHGSLNTMELKLVSHFSIISQTSSFCSFKFCAHMCDTVEF